MDKAKIKTAIDWVKRIGGAIGAWLWLIKILVAVLGCAVLFISVKGWQDANTALASYKERTEKLAGQIVAADATAAQLRKEKGAILADSDLLRARYAELEKEVGRLTVTGTVDVSTPVGGATAHGAPREPAKPPLSPPPVILRVPEAPEVVLLRAGDKGHIRIRALTLETPGKNNVILAEGICYRDVPGPTNTEILRDTARVDLSTVLKLAPPKDPGVGIGPLLVAGKQGLLVGALVSPATYNFHFLWSFQTELLLGGAANANGDWQVLAGALARLR